MYIAYTSNSQSVLRHNLCEINVKVICITSFVDKGTISSKIVKYWVCSEVQTYFQPYKHENGSREIHPPKSPKVELIWDFYVFS